MKIKSIAAAGAIGLGMGFAGLIGARHRVGRCPMDSQCAPYAGDVIA